MLHSRSPNHLQPTAPRDGLRASKELQNLLEAVVAVIPEESFAASFPWAQQGTVGEVKCSKTCCLLAVSVFSTLSKCIQTLAFLHQRYSAAKPEHMLEKEALKFDVVVATSELKAAALDAKTKFANTAISELANHCWEPSLAMVQGWFGRLDVLLQTWGRHLVWVAAEHMAIISTELQKVIPVYSHFVHEAKINVSMVKKQLLVQKVRTPLKEKTVALHQAMGLHQALVNEWGAPPEIDPEESPHSCATLAFEAGKKAITVIAACAVVYEQGPTRKQEAATLLAVQRPEIPNSLWAELQKVAKGGGVKDEDASSAVVPQ